MLTGTCLLRACCALPLFMLVLVQPSSSFLTPYMLSKSITNYGDITLFKNVNAKLKAGGCLNLTAFGGSVTAGTHQHVTLPLENTWPHLVAQNLNSIFPCDGLHTALNVGRGGMSANYWIEQFSGRREELLGSADIVMGDTAVNGISERLHMSQEAEVLMSLIVQKPAHARGNSTLRLPTGAAALWIVASTRRDHPVWSGVPYERESDAMFAQLPVAQHHGVPLVSVIDALGPFPTEESQRWFNETWYEGDRLHPAELGHQLIATCIIHFIRTQYEQYLHGFPRLDTAAYQPRPPIFNEERVIDMYLSHRPVSVYLLFQSWIDDRKASSCRNWHAGADVAGKNGFICEQPQKPCTLALRPEEVERLTLGEMHIQALRTYENVGTFNTTITARPVGANNNCTAVDGPDGGLGEYLGSSVFDGLWEPRVSEVATEQVKFKLPSNPARTCLYVTFTVVPSNRPVNKVKITGLMLY